MAVSVNTSGSQTATIGTEHTLATITAAGTYQLGVNCVNMVGGTVNDPDILELRIYVKLDTGDDSECVFSARFVGAQGDGAAPGSSAKGTVIKFSMPVGAPIEFVATLKQTAPSGGGRVFDWAIYEY